MYYFVYIDIFSRFIANAFPDLNACLATNSCQIEINSNGGYLDIWSRRRSGEGVAFSSSDLYFYVSLCIANDDVVIVYLVSIQLGMYVVRLAFFLYNKTNSVVFRAYFASYRPYSTITP